LAADALAEESSLGKGGPAGRGRPGVPWLPMIHSLDHESSQHVSASHSSPKTRCGSTSHPDICGDAYPELQQGCSALLRVEEAPETLRGKTQKLQHCKPLLTFLLL